MTDPASCRRCGAVRDPADPAALAWVTDVDTGVGTDVDRARGPGGATRWICPACAREHIRDIEAKLPDDWW